MDAPVYRQAKRLTNKGYEVKVDHLGTKAWYKDGLLHREGGPAVEWPEGSKFWDLNGMRHRVDGPAEEWASGDRKWYLHGTRVSEEAFKEVWECPLDRLPLYINTEFAPIVKRRLSQNESLHR